ncbi:MAG: glycerol-3-phosphate 1-O-acyltransferase PlsY [Candidatus Margulisbacteria bacterium]|nr:glycerol-3-phosphate 1-O-acyltransferase PlsY [Candidatus Margulisiibacteriota bacterium]MBU1022322.1 glycerol-3-phosphate 1-O-acyltransferase PlsY [Candidatus Margulisiibacteriota bacterium]MBU1729935.1 glycerol-3-phosphate 1-O-acyltransferase PlsY [Candidatus Margulisiibacteriota bacterium]MBU1955968.1 glycerol-3-phosphate 1-O-acyltransferase PlsY [Candidatus Margulisiibacteriota bacterium]
MHFIVVLLLVIISYLIGSIPFGYLLTKFFKGKDVRTKGTGNIGASNTLLVGGKRAGFLTLFLDMLKGTVAVLLALTYGRTDMAVILCGLAVVIGHDFPIFLKFKGGKGIAPTGGAMFAVDPVITVICLLCYALVLVITRYVILSTLIVLALLPVLLWMASFSFDYILFGFLLFLLALYTHRADIKRFLSGEEVTIDKSRVKYTKEFD